jgi:hypothetical protein
MKPLHSCGSPIKHYLEYWVAFARQILRIQLLFGETDSNNVIYFEEAKLEMHSFWRGKYLTYLQ